ncbi:hypothetical protein BU26DRAFT_569161 [Trematosphaeria pertusa]|uniref:Uncharacterized protein n=1 Tax=Trematosphaeria pertusa TaxID=390896 RepID=A0A6A6I2G8_9PLEO|nr:uncharacterized protein BU26DRAFT_569161 [Trematosphaeria pertusa]KAF2244162.1 hypothetical protein BU26DRAFT_569161 [Trematosphaeria pertusa]
MSRTTSISAALFLTPSDYDLYLQWQEAEGTSEEHLGYVSYAVEYHDFTIWRATGWPCLQEHSTARSKYVQGKQRVASRCLHTLHLASFIETEWCPVCEVNICLEFLEALVQAYEKVGRQMRESKLENEYEQLVRKHKAIRMGWRMARLELIEVVRYHEELATCEMEWDLHYDDLDTDDSHSSSFAVTLAVLETRHPADIVSQEELAMMHSDRTPKKKPQATKKVRFATQLETTRSPRHEDTFDRSNKQYQPGKWACPIAEGWQDTSFYMSDLHNLQQFKVFITSIEDPDDVDMSKGDEGPAGLHPFWPQIEFIWERSMKNANRAQYKQLIKKMDESEAVVAFVDNNGNVADMAFAGRPKDTEWKPEIPPPSDMAWTSLQMHL